LYTNITNYFETLVNLSKIINKYKKKLENNAIIKKDIFDIIIEQLSFIKIYI